MPLPVLLGLVIGGIALVLFVTHALGGSQGPRLDEANVRATFGAEHPDRTPDRIAIDTAGQTALLWLADGQVGVVVLVGDHRAVRIVDDAAVEWRGPTKVRVRFGEVGWPPRMLTLPSDAKITDPNA